MIDLTPLENASKNLTDALRLTESMEKTAEEPIRLLLRAGLIQTFEYNYELSVLMLTRYLRSVTVDDKRDLGVFEEFIRVADERQLLLSPFPTWKAFRQARNTTSHAYDEQKALSVLAVIPAFEKEVKYLLAQLQERIAQ